MYLNHAIFTFVIYISFTQSFKNHKNNHFIISTLAIKLNLAIQTLCENDIDTSKYYATLIGIWELK